MAAWFSSRLFSSVEGRLRDGCSIYADLAGKDTGGGHVFPSDDLVTSQRPDIVVINASERKVFIFELIFDTNIDTYISVGLLDFETLKRSS